MTISDSKRAFHTSFPYLIPPIYRRIIDELLVELHLLYHQKDFKVDYLFAVGLKTVFNSFTKGYKPENHLEELFSSICTSTGIEQKVVERLSEEALAIAAAHTIQELKDFISQNSVNGSESLQRLFTQTKSESFYYSRLVGIGLFKLVNTAKSIDISSEAKPQEIALEISEHIGLKAVRVEKDITLYINSLEKITQAFELKKEAAIREQKKRAFT